MKMIKKMAVVGGKLALAGAILCGTGWAILTQDVAADASLGDVPEAQADIVDGAVVDGTEFTRAIASLGFKPRAYDMNGNVMYFATGTAPGKSPHQVMNIIQDEMVEYGVNSKNWLGEAPLAGSLAKSDFQQTFDPAKGFDRSKLESIDNGGISAAMLNGELVPIQNDKNYIATAGVTPGRDVKEVVADFQAAGGRSPIRDFTGGYRFVDATGEPGEDSSMVTAVWTDENFDAKKMDNRAFKQQPADPNVPACVGCEREFRFQSLQKDEPFRNNKWTAKNASMDNTYDFYQTAMANRGWSESGVQAKLSRLGQYFPEVNQIPGRTLNMTKDGQNMTITLIPSPNGGTEVFSSEQYGDTQGGLNAGVPE